MENVLVRTSTPRTDLPARSRLYSLAPIGVGTLMGECLTSYVNRLAWMYRIGPHILATQEIIPKLASPHRLPPSNLSHNVPSDAMRINGAGEVAVDWSATLERLTMRTDLRYLNAHLWASGLPTRAFVRVTPVWCPVCYQEWHEDDFPIYQPLLWMFQVVTICLKHKKKLESQCSNCQRHQAIIASIAQPVGYCTACRIWLGTMSSGITDDEIDDDTFAWQEWVMSTIGDLSIVSESSKLPQWESIRFGLDICRKTIGGSKQLAHMLNVPEVSLSRWVNAKNMPSLESLLKLCYVLDLSPLQLMTSDPSNLEEAMKTKMNYRPPRNRNPSPLPKKQEHTLELIQAVLDGREVPHSIRQIERRLGLGRNIVVYHYPEEAALVAAQYQAYCREKERQRIDHTRDEVRAATFSLYAQGIFPSRSRVFNMLSDPNRVFEPEARKAWHTARRELGLEP
jgi:transcriptional regulator with XRE-family HTH domain